MHEIMFLTKKEKEEFLRILTDGPYIHDDLNKHDQLEEWKRCKYLDDEKIIICRCSMKGWDFHGNTDKGDGIKQELEKELNNTTLKVGSKKTGLFIIKTIWTLFFVAFATLIGLFVTDIYNSRKESNTPPSQTQETSDTKPTE